MEQGALKIERIDTKKKPLSESLLRPLHRIDPSFVVHIGYYTTAAVKSIRFYGNHWKENIQEIDPHIELEDIKTYGFNQFPFIDCNSIEFLVIEHTDQSKTVITLDKGGFRYKLNEKGTLAQLIPQSYLIINGCIKNIVLQHEISK